MGTSTLVVCTVVAHNSGMAQQRETATTSAGQADRLDEERTIVESEVDVDPAEPLDASIETPIEDALDQRRVEVLDDEEHDVP